MPVLPQPDIRPGVAAREYSTSPIIAAFNAQVQAENAKESSVQSLARGASLVQGVVQGQQAIDINEQNKRRNELLIEQQKLENERKEVANKLELEELRRKRSFVAALNNGNINEQANALLSASPETIQKNLDIALATANRIRRLGGPALKEEMENFIKDSDPQSYIKEQQAIQKRQDDIDRAEREKNKQLEIARAKKKENLYPSYGTTAQKTDQALELKDLQEKRKIQEEKKKLADLENGKPAKALTATDIKNRAQDFLDIHAAENPKNKALRQDFQNRSNDLAALYRSAKAQGKNTVEGKTYQEAQQELINTFSMGLSDAAKLKLGVTTPAAASPGPSPTAAPTPAPIASATNSAPAQGASVNPQDLAGKNSREMIDIVKAKAASLGTAPTENDVQLIVEAIAASTVATKRKVLTKQQKEGIAKLIRADLGLPVLGE